MARVRALFAVEFETDEPVHVDRAEIMDAEWTPAALYDTFGLMEPKITPVSVEEVEPGPPPHTYIVRVTFKSQMGEPMLPQEKLRTTDRGHAMTVANILQRSNSVSTAYVVERDEHDRWVRNW
jgi:hypothetical protein